MNRGLEILRASREELVVYLKSWGQRYKDTAPDFELRLIAHKNFRRAGPGMGPAPAVQDEPKPIPEGESRR